ncbi:MAG: hypothetical protein QOE97_3164 [Pseudonocardiales bacterium]|jgi:hypothetical protein|nr:hypothetical protein [Pseudonocardiales bacterium]
MPARARAATAAGVLLAAAVLTACSKPAPKVTVLGGGKVVNITPSTYCFDAAHCPKSSSLDLPVLTVAADEAVMIDVPRQVEGRGWQAQALTLDGSKVLGASGAIDTSHSYRVPSATNGGNAFIVQVDELHGGKPDGSVWSFLVKVSLTK